MTERPLKEDEVQAKLVKYERFIDEKLRPDLDRVLKKRETYEQELSQ